VAKAGAKVRSGRAGPEGFADRAAPGLFADAGTEGAIAEPAHYSGHRERLRARFAARSVDVVVHDHVVIGKEREASFRALGLF